MSPQNAEPRLNSTGGDKAGKSPQPCARGINRNPLLPLRQHKKGEAAEFTLEKPKNKTASTSSYFTHLISGIIQAFTTRRQQTVYQ